MNLCCPKNGIKKRAITPHNKCDLIPRESMAYYPWVLYLPHLSHLPLKFDTYPSFLVPLYLLFLFEKYHPPYSRWSPYYMQHIITYLHYLYGFFIGTVTSYTCVRVMPPSRPNSHFLFLHESVLECLLWRSHCMHCSTKLYTVNTASFMFV